ncbi:MAG TPA: EamA family transporter [Mariprofundaceae bacterium]|nr:EamA family transporter [Mariprofundaceae bacterium]
METLSRPGIAAALAAAALFGIGTPLAKGLLGSTGPWMMAGLLYLGSGLGLGLYRRWVGAPAVRLPAGDIPCLAGAVVAGGIIAPVLLMIGLTSMPASAASLLLNAETVFTALLAWFMFRENVDPRVALGMAAIVAGAVVLGWPHEAHFAGLWPDLAVLGACLAWGIDNNLTRRVSLADATWVATVKGLVAGPVNLAMALSLGASLPAMPALAGGLVVGLFAYGVSLVLFVIGLRHLGTARTSAYFSVAPFFGAAVAVLMGDAVDLRLLAAAGLMAIGIWLHLSERHEHEHTHEAMEHDHEHVHDEHHQHAHETPVAPGMRHRHPHRHEPITHTHPHFPDSHHRHKH